jgi:AraC-like DNA-binding protein
MLCEDQLPIYRIAETLGFSETASFAMPSCAGVVWRRASSALDSEFRCQGVAH